MGRRVAGRGPHQPHRIVNSAALGDLLRSRTRLWTCMSTSLMLGLAAHPNPARISKSTGFGRSAAFSHPNLPALGDYWCSRTWTLAETSATGTSWPAPLRGRTSTRPSLRPRPTITITGTPSSSASLNLAPGATLGRSS